MDFNKPPTMPAPQSVAELLEQRREANAGKIVEKFNHFTRRYLPEVRSRGLEMLDEEIQKKHAAGVSIVGDILSSFREKAFGKKNLLTREELKEFQDLCDRGKATEMVTLTPDGAQNYAGDCYTFLGRLIETYGEAALEEEGRMLTALAGYAIMEAREWNEENGYVMNEKEWEKLGRPNVGHMTAGLSVNRGEVRNSDGYLIGPDGMPVPGSRQ